MYHSGIRGFSRRITIVIITIFILVGLVVVGYFLFSGAQQSRATTIGSEFVSDINTKSIDGYKLLTPSFQKKINSVFSYIIWTSSFSQNTLTVTPKPMTVTHTNSSIFYPQYTLVYKISNGELLKISVLKQNSAWLISNYEVDG